MGFSTGVDKTINGKVYNLVKATYEKGAHFVLGTTEIVSSADAIVFLDAFMAALSEGENIKEAISAGQSEFDGTFPIMYIGDTYQYFN